MISDLSKRFRAWTVDYDGRPMDDREPPLDGARCKDFRNICDEIDRLQTGEANRDELILTLISERDDLREQLVKRTEALKSIVAAWDKFCAEELQLNEGVEQAIDASRALTDEQHQPDGGSGGDHRSF